MRIGVGIVGYGKQGANHARILKQQPDFQLIAVSDPTPASLQQAAKDNENIEVYEHFSDMLGNPDIDLIVIVTPTTTHAPLSIESMKSGKHVVCEKPMCVNGGEAAEIRDVSNQTGQLFSVYQNRRGDDYFTKAKAVLNSGRIGQLRDSRIIRCRWSIGAMVWGSERFRPQWRSERAYGGGMLYDWGGHWIDQALLLHESLVTSVYANLFVGNRVLGQDADDGFRLFLTFTDGSRAHIEFQTASLGALDTGGWILNGTRGGYVPGNIFELVTPDEPVTSEVMESPWDEAPAPFDFWGQMSDAINQRDRDLVPVPVHESVRVMQIIDAAFESHDKRQVVKFASPI